MSQRLNKILNKGESLSRGETGSYFDKSLSDADKHAIEEKMAEDDFSNEAMEGFENDPSALSEMNSLNEQWNAKHNSVASSGAAYKSLFWFSASVAVVACVVIVVLLSQNNNKPEKENIIAQNEIKDPAENSIPVSEEKILEEIETAKPIEKSEQITYEKTVKAQPKTIIDVTAVNPAVIPEIKPEPVGLKKADEIKTPEPEKTVVRSNVKFTYLQDLKVVDYRELYTSNIKKTQLILTGVSADKENAGTKIEPEYKTVLIPYEDYLNETMEEYKSNNYKNALKNFRIIHEHYPEDLNAFFYSGLCYYNLGKFDKAIEYFDKCINNSFSTFEEEAEWNKALCLMKKKKNKEAEELLVKIIARRGHYSRLASEKIKEL